jgi:hypothetical protein
VIEQKREWLSGVSWESIVGLNRTLCQVQKMEALVNAETFSALQHWWEQTAPMAMNLVEALTICRDARGRLPFIFNNGNTFAALARGLVEDALRDAPAVESQILRATISHYVAGTVGKKELQQVLTQLAVHFVHPEKAPAPVHRSVIVPAPASIPAPASSPAPTPRLREAHPLA